MSFEIKRYSRFNTVDPPSQWLEPDENGDLVFYSDVLPLVERIKELECELNEVRLEIEPMKMSYAEQIDIIGSLRTENETLKQERSKLLAEINTHAHITMTVAKQRDELEAELADMKMAYLGSEKTCQLIAEERDGLKAQLERGE